MIRIKRGITAHAKHKKIIKLAKGYYGSRSRIYRVAKQAVIKAHQYSYIDRKKKKRYFRRLWIIRIKASLMLYNLTYNKFINLLFLNKIKINRKILCYISIYQPVIFKYLILFLIKKN